MPAYRVPCSKCGTTDYPKYKRIKLRDNGKRSLSRASYCILCHSEDQKIREERRYQKKLAYNREWKKNNRDKANASARKYHKKNKDRINEHKRMLYSIRHPEALGTKRQSPFWKHSKGKNKWGEFDFKAEVRWKIVKRAGGTTGLTYEPLVDCEAW